MSLIHKPTRREIVATLGKAAVLSPLLGSVLLDAGCGGGQGTSTGPGDGGYTGTDDQLMGDIERAAYSFFWQGADPNTGLMKDRSLAAGNDTSTISSIASTGFGLATLCIGDSRGYGQTAEIVALVKATLNFLLNEIQNVNGFFYHFIDLSTGARAYNSEVSSIDSTILLCGVLTCRQHFTDPEIISMATQIYERVNWPWMLNGGATFSQGWTPESGFLIRHWDSYSELMMLYLLAIGSTTNPVSPATWQAWARPTITYNGLTYISGSPPLFIHQYSHAWFDFRNKTDAYANYFQNSVTATTAHRLFCLSLATQFGDYSGNLWGITSSDSANGYVSWGGPPTMGPIDGTVVPCATCGSLPFLYSDCMQVLRYIRGTYPAAWQLYGFVDAFNPLTGWFDNNVVGIDLGIMALMAENQRTGFVWQTFMQNPEVANAMVLAGFTAD